jgi:hypothetical protein
MDDIVCSLIFDYGCKNVFLRTCKRYYYIIKDDQTRIHQLMFDELMEYILNFDFEDCKSIEPTKFNYSSITIDNSRMSIQKKSTPKISKEILTYNLFLLEWGKEWRSILNRYGGYPYIIIIMFDLPKCKPLFQDKECFKILTQYRKDGSYKQICSTCY